MAEASGSRWSFKFNAGAPEFVPRSQAQTELPVTSYLYPYVPYVDGISCGSWIYVADQETTFPAVEPHLVSDDNDDELNQMIIKQAEYMFSDMSILANESFAEYVNKEHQGLVPMDFVSTANKLNSLSVDTQTVARALRSSASSPRLVVSDNGKKVRRRQALTDKEKEDLQLRTVVVENLPDDHSHENIEKLFSVVGSIKSIRICQPQESNTCRSSKGDLVVSNKLHALVEYENSEAAEKAAEKLNDERNWRKGMRVRVMLKRSPKSVLRSRKSDFDMYSDDDQGPAHEDASRANSLKPAEAGENPVGLKRSWSRNRGKPRHCVATPCAVSSNCVPAAGKPTLKGPRMPDGTRGFSMGRGKPLCVPV
ncbi:UNVERIFIED_CONTAM: La-related protein 6C [Sesamum radiatum]|uniref:La-related protein 6C n=1 Tax=Sesamum radiatum TaxID=300843 RepID=A0AAW2MVJ4_SESRA